ncbi:hypothetical protein B2G71_13555 [Novosphingobium sp. PC22D]|uniref:DUF1700 domain-containing protein n=1 Tax=Novosphingobium sp. PC22D TaxID=1962403 RepID=UPI000BEF8F00|nr:DUF1700 domain-containing protein [Novosphingobium sp. PC22D]PEQ12161.1 hypothetical protein B2G71_13555 [Novosphingobium sp. PC22D]
MTRNEFIRRLKAGLKGMTSQDVAEIVADYEAHFDSGAAEGRSEQEVAQALGDPSRLARELRFEAGLRNWQTDRSPSSAFAAIIGFMGLATIDILILLPIVLSVIGVIFAFYVAIFAIFVSGGFVLIVGPFQGFPGGALAAIFAGLGLMGGSIAAGALLTIVSIWVINALLWFGRLHYRVIEPAIKSDDA